MPKPKKIINDPENAVAEFIQGLLAQFPNTLTQLSGQDVILKKNLTPQVQLLSGGGSGHEPSHAGWIGEGMLSGAILGGIFASPSVAAVLSAVRNVSAYSDKSPVLLVVKNYTGDRLNFAMACEKANMEGIQCAMVVVADDCALERFKGITGARGVAGTVLVHKIAGAAAAKGKSLDEVVVLAKEACSRMGTLGVALDAVTVPGAAQINDRLDDETIEIGLGIHGEAGMRQSPLLSADELSKEMLDSILKYGREENGSIVPMWNKGDEVCLLVNNLGGTSNFEMSILANSAIKILEGTYEVKVGRVAVGSFMTSFDMHGASLTVLNLAGASSDLVECLDATTSAPAWTAVEYYDPSTPRGQPLEAVKVAEVAATASNLPPADEWSESDAAALLKKAAEALAAAEPLLTKYDTIVGDGDCGITMKRGATKVMEEGVVSTSHPVTMFAQLADAVSASMGGTSGVLLELMFRKMSSTLSRCDKIASSDLAKAFEAGVEAVSLYGGATVGARTMLDSLVPAAASLVATGSIPEAAQKAKEGADSTASMMQASAGRSNYLSEETLSGTPDPGAVAVATVLEALSA